MSVALAVTMGGDLSPNLDAVAAVDKPHGGQSTGGVEARVRADVDKLAVHAGVAVARAHQER